MSNAAAVFSQTVEDRLRDLNQTHDRIYLQSLEHELAAVNDPDPAVRSDAEDAYTADRHRLDALAEHAADLAPTTLLGFGLKARILSQACHEWWAHDAAAVEVLGRNLIEQLLAVSGLKPHPIEDRGLSLEEIKCRIQAMDASVAPRPDSLASDEHLLAAEHRSADKSQAVGNDDIALAALAKASIHWCKRARNVPAETALPDGPEEVAYEATMLSSREAFDRMALQPAATFHGVLAKAAAIQFWLKTYEDDVCELHERHAIEGLLRDLLTLGGHHA